MQSDPFDVARLRQEGWHVYGVAEWSDLVAFARMFSQRIYEPPGQGKGRTLS